MAKKFAPVFAGLLISCFLVSAQPADNKKDVIKWMTVQEAVKATQKQPKKMFVDVYTNWCGWCKKMDATTFEDPAIVDYMNKNYYAVKFNAETKDTIVVKDKEYMYKAEYKANEFAAQMLNGSMSYPTSVYIDEMLNEIGPVPGYLTAQQLLPILKYFAEDIYKVKKWEDYLNENFK